MKTIRSLMTLAGLILAVFALSATGAKAQVVKKTAFAGTFTLSHAAKWGTMALPTGNYSLTYGTSNGLYLVEVQGTVKGSPHDLIIAPMHDPTSAVRSALDCVRDGNTLIVRALQMPSIGTALYFAAPSGAQFLAHNMKHKGYTQLAEAPMLIQRIPVTLNAR